MKVAIKPKDIYKGRQKTHRTAKITVACVVILLILVITAFFVIRSWAVFDEAGNATIVWPWERPPEDDGGEDGEPSAPP